MDNINNSNNSHSVISSSKESILQIKVNYTS